MKDFQFAPRYISNLRHFDYVMVDFHHVDDKSGANSLGVFFISRLVVNVMKFLASFSAPSPVDYVMVDFHHVDDKSVKRLAEMVHNMGKKCVATGVDDEDLYHPRIVTA